MCGDIFVLFSELPFLIHQSCKWCQKPFYGDEFKLRLVLKFQFTRFVCVWVFHEPKHPTRLYETGVNHIAWQQYIQPFSLIRNYAVG